MSSQGLLQRATGGQSVRAFEHAEHARQILGLEYDSFHFDGRNDRGAAEAEPESLGQVPGKESIPLLAHPAGVNTLAIDAIEGRYLLSGGADSSILLWDLDAEKATQAPDRRIHPASRVRKSPDNHKRGLSHLSFYPFDSQAFISSSYDHTVKVYATETLIPSASFDLQSVVYSHAISPIADHLLIACATQHSTVRLLDMRSGASTHVLAGHRGAILTTAWSPRNEYILASGGIDGTARLWDIRKGAANFASLDFEDSVGCFGDSNRGIDRRHKAHGQAHLGPCNGVVWKDDGQYLITAGHDEQARVWDVATGANTLANFGPLVKNKNLATLLPVIAPDSIAGRMRCTMLYPSENEILVFEIFEGDLLKRIKMPRVMPKARNERTMQRNSRARITSLCWQPFVTSVFSAHSDGFIRAWRPAGANLEDEDGQGNAEGQSHLAQDDERTRKRKALDQVFQELTQQKITFT